MTIATALWTLQAETLGLQSEPLPERAEGNVRCRALYSAISRGTESLVFRGLVPASEWQRMRAPFQSGDFPFPVKYGYQIVAEVLEGPLAQGTRVFTLHPHQDVFDVPAHMARPLPDALPSRRAVLAANMETALNALWDSAAAPGNRIAVIGAGIVGLLVAHLASQLPGADVTLVDVDPGKAAIAASLGLTFAATAPADCDQVFHVSGHPSGLASAMNAAGMEATIIELSWYGDAAVAAPLGGAFHSRRLKLISSQVGQIAPSHRPRWDYARRLGKALDLLLDDRLDQLLEADMAFLQTPQLLPPVLAKPGALAQVIRY
jgi:NADPH:quinone reductase-like Zn-dependent oxidoreductase